MLKKKWFLYVTEFFSGMSVMAIELGASRLLAPYFSSSQIIWTIIIGAIMISMALGNLWGGRMADKDPNPDRLYGRLLIVAVWTAAIPFAGKYVIVGISLLLAAVSGQNFLILASLLSCLIIFVFPLMLLGTVSPSLVKYTVGSLDSSGKTVGELNALNTIGSIIGTFTPTFITIPSIGTSMTFVVFSGILLIISLVYFISEKKKIIKSIIALLLTIAFSIAAAQNSFAFWESGEGLYEDESIYNYLKVNETDNTVILSTNVLFGVQSISRKDNAITGMYYDYALAAPVMANILEKEEFNILILGFGSGTFAKQCRYYFPNSNITGVEIDSKIIDLAFERFGIDKEDRNINVVEFDGRAFLKDEGKYDLIMVDAYRDITIPFQMSTKEFFSEIYLHLEDDGVMIVNLNMVSENSDSINDWICDTIAGVFETVSFADIGSNREVYAAKDRDVIDFFDSEKEKVSDIELKGLFDRISEKLEEYRGGDLILTDDKAPVELLGMKVVDEMITSELEYYKEVFKDKSIFEIIDYYK